MPVISSNRLEIDATQAISTLNSIQAAFTSHNAAVGAVAAQYGSFNASGRGAITTFTQINEAGQRVTTTVRELNGSYEILNTRISAASNSQRRLAADLERQRTLADTLARQVSTAGASSRTPTTTPGVVNPALIGQSAEQFRALTQQQVAAAAAANNLNAAQTAALQNTVNQGSRAQQAFVSLRERAEGFRAKLGEFQQIAFATTIYRALSLLQLGFTQGTKSAAEYSRQVALVTTLSRESGDTFEVWSTQIRRVADEFGRPATEVAKAAYDGLSNQVIKTSRDLTLLEQSFALARSTGSEGGATLNVLSSILNTYGSTAGNVTQITDKLFKTVDLGRVRINELNGVIGRSASIAKTAGVSFDEVAAGLIVLTQTGLDSAESATLLNNVYSQLIKPNDALAEQIKKMGFDSGAAAVQTLGFAGVMQKLGDASKDTAEKIATFFPEIRGLRGASALDPAGLQKFISALKEVEKAEGDVKKANDELAKSAGFKLGDEVNRIKNFFTVDLGQAAIEAVAKVTGALGGMSNVTETATKIFIGLGGSIAAAFIITKVVTFGSTIGTLITGLVTLTNTFGASTAANVIFGQSIIVTRAGLVSLLGVFGGVTLAAYALVTAYIKLGQANSNRGAELAASFEKEISSNKAAVEKEANDRISAFNRSVDEMTRLYGSFIAKAKTLNTEFLNDTKEKAKGISEALTNNFQVLLGVARKNVSDAEAAQKQSEDNIAQIKKDRITLTDQYEKKAFERAIERLAEIRQANLAAASSGADGGYDNRNQIAELIAQRNNIIRSKLKIAVDTGDLDHAKRFLTEIEGNLDKLKEFRFTGINSASQKELQNYLNLTEQLRVKEIARTAELAKQVASEEQQLKVLEDTARKVAEFSTKGVFDKDTGKLLPKFEKDPSIALKELDSLQNKAIGLAQTLKGVGDPVTLIRYNLALKEIDKTFAEQKANLQLLLQGSERDIALTKAGEARIALANEEKKLNEQLTKELAEQKNVIDANIVAAKQLAAEIRRENFGGGTTGSHGLIGALANVVSGSEIGGENIGAITQITGELSTLLEAAKTDIPATITKINELETALKQKAPQLKFVDPKDKENILDVAQAIDQLRSSILTIKSVSDVGAAIKNNLDTVKLQIADMDAKTSNFIEKAFPGLQRIADAEQRVIDVGSNIDTITAKMKGYADAANTAAFALERLSKVGPIAPPVIKAPSTGGAVEGFADGGVAGSKGGFLGDFLSGRYARGTDTIPAMLSKGEFVVRAPMADRYYSQLIAMNAGHAPIYRAQGGPVSNTRVGDIHISITGGGKSVNAKQLAGEIRRGIKQGTMKIN